MKKYYGIFGICIVCSIIMAMVLIYNSAFYKTNSVVYNDYLINMDNWSYYTNIDSDHKEVKLPWIPEYSQKGVTIYMESKIPDITFRQSLLIKTNFKQIKVTVNGETIYDSKMTNSKDLTKGVGRGMDFIDIPSRYSGKKIIIEVKSPFPQSSGMIKSVELSNKAAHITKMIKLYGFDNIIALVMICTGGIAGVIFLVTCFTSRKYVNLLCIGVVSICCGVWIIGETNLYQIIYNNPSIGYLFEYIGFYVMPIPLLIFIITTYKLKYENIIIRLISTFTAFLLLVLFAQVTGIMELHRSVSIYHIILIFSSMILVGVLFIEAKTKDKDFILFFIGFTVMVMCGIIDIALLYIRPMKGVTGFYKLGILIFIFILCVSIGRYIVKLIQRKVKNEMLMNIAYKDITTGLSNRRLFDEVMEEINNTINYSSNIAIIVVDLDNLKITNDSKGHAEGDKLILLSAFILEQAYKNVGRAFRIGGDEFVIICENQSLMDIEESHRKMDSLIQEYKSETKKNIGMSWGIAFYNYEIDETIYDVFTRADKNMYKHKLEKKEIKEIARI